MAVYGMAATDGPFQKLCQAFDNCVRAWGKDPAYADYRFQIEQAMRGISLLEASPGQRAAMNMPIPYATGGGSPPPTLPSQSQGEEQSESK